MKKKLYVLLVITILVSCAYLAKIISEQYGSTINEYEQQASQNKSYSTASSGKTNQQLLNSPDTLKVHFIDVGQADSILVQSPGGKNMLIDAGNNSDGEKIVSYLASQAVRSIDILIGTHPHEDHIGGMDTVINTFTIGKIFMPQVTTTTKTFSDVLTSAQAKKLKITTAKAGAKLDLGADIKLEMLAPNSKDYEEINNYSAVVKLTFGETSFLFEGDAEDVSEKELLQKKYNLKADVLKLGHHGSSSSTTTDFLKAVSPKAAIVSAGKDNDYGHPHKQTMEKLKKEGISVYRTDESGTIICVSDGKTITFNVEPGTYNPGKK